MFHKNNVISSKTLVTTWKILLAGVFFLAVPLGLVSMMKGGTPNVAVDPGVRGGPAGAGSPVAGLTQGQTTFFNAGLAEFMQADSVTGTVPNTGRGLGPTFNAESCAQCHAQPVAGGSSPAVNPQVGAANDQGATNEVPFFITINGPVREARFPYTSDLKKADGGVHDLFTITGRGDATGCTIQQPDFNTAANQHNLIFRIPTPTFGDGLIESIPDSVITDNRNSATILKRVLGIVGRVNTSGNDGTITRFGWKAQNKSIEIFAGEAYNVEVGVSNELFPNERNETRGCRFNPTPEDTTNFDQDGTELASDLVRFTAFMRFLDQPKPAHTNSSVERGRLFFEAVGCSLCHTPAMTTGASAVSGLNHVKANLFSDLLIHHMGPRLADNVSQGAAAGDEFRTAPLWGLGQRIFFMHDGRTSDLVTAIHEHESHSNGQYPASEANAVVEGYKHLHVQEQQDLLNFLRSL